MTGARLDVDIVVERPGFTLEAALRAESGEVVAVMGPSGAGKSTIFGAIAGLEPIDRGHVRLGAQTLDDAPHPRSHVPPSRRGVVLLGQDPRLFPHLSALDNVAFGLLAHGAPKRTVRADADDWLSRVGLSGLGTRRPTQLSGGQQQRVAIARALATSPAALLLDEPFTSLDTETAGDIRAMLRDQLTATRTTALVATHEPVDAVAVASRLVVIERGRVTQSGDVREVLGSPATRFVASVSGLNRVVGAFEGDHWTSGGMVLPREDSGREVPAGAVAAVFAPGAVRLDPVAASGGTDEAGAEASARVWGEWIARVVRLEQTPAGVRVRTAAPEVAVDLPADRAAEADVRAGALVRLRIDPAEVRFIPAAPEGVADSS